MVINDGTYDRFAAGKLNGEYGIIIRDAAGNITCDLGNIMGASNYQYVSAEDEISTDSTSYIDMTDMTITHTFPKCVALIMSICRLDTSTDDATNALTRFDVDGDTTGYWSGIPENLKLSCTNMHIEELAAGEHTIKIQWSTNDVTGDFIYCVQRRLMVLYWEVQ